MEDDVAPNTLIEEGTHHVEKDVEDPEDGQNQQSQWMMISYNHKKGQIRWFLIIWKVT